MAQEKLAKRIGEQRVQVDRWPLTNDRKTEYVLTIVVVGAYKEKPSTAAIQKALEDAITTVGFSQ